MNIIPHNRPTLGIEEELAAQRIIRSGWLAQGEEVGKLEDAFCDFIGLPKGHAVAVSSGTSALFLALKVLHAENTKIAFPSYVCAAVRYAVSMAGGQEEVIDINQHSPNISIPDLNESKSVIAIVPHMFGNPVEINQIKGKTIIEDCCQAIGASINGVHVGLHGELGIFSFYATKLLTTGGQGGMVVSRNKSLIDEIKDYREFDMRPDKKMRFNFQMTDLQAAIGIEQLKKLPAFLDRREQIFNRYLQSGILLQPSDQNKFNSKSVRYRAILKTHNQETLLKNLADNHIKAIIPIEKWELLAQTVNAVQYSEETISLPLYPSLTDSQVEYIIQSIS